MVSENRAVATCASIVLIMSISCATRTARSVELSSGRSWNGQLLAKVVEVWGTANTSESDGLGGRILTYRASGDARDVPDTTTPRPSADPRFPSSAQGVRPAAPEQRLYEEGEVLARFWVSSDDRVYRYYFAPSVWRKQPQKAAPAPPS